MQGLLVCMCLLTALYSLPVPATMTLSERWEYFTSFSSILHGVNVTWSSATGFGFKLLKDVKQGDCVIELPLNYALTSADTYTLTPYLPSDFDPFELLSLRVAYEKFIPKRPHHAKQFVDSLPTDPFHMFQYWNNDDFVLFNTYSLVGLDT